VAQSVANTVTLTVTVTRQCRDAQSLEGIAGAVAMSPPSPSSRAAAFSRSAIAGSSATPHRVPTANCAPRPVEPNLARDLAAGRASFSSIGGERIWGSAAAGARMAATLAREFSLSRSREDYASRVDAKGW
jgi:hypothetical protein